ncbi:hypothetical protein [Gandjariella thermophila]|uniref:Uncharacterized protein n=1 Tax=Gandjariella thermophila TaxID=1931992 RepID=A0A4D4JCM3_9PSEU|nr:hypothetical protein [Gandjariella thermophila]GDY32408.1 hypothetical protein GTS_40410 [Gandjariella thermophila]
MTRFRERPQWREPARHRRVEDEGWSHGTGPDPGGGPDRGFSGVLDGTEPAAHAGSGRHADAGHGSDGGPPTTPIPPVRDQGRPTVVRGNAEDTQPLRVVRSRPATSEPAGAADTYLIQTENAFGDTQFAAPPVIGE